MAMRIIIFIVVCPGLNPQAVAKRLGCLCASMDKTRLGHRLFAPRRRRRKIIFATMQDLMQFRRCECLTDPFEALGLGRPLDGKNFPSPRIFPETGIN